MDSSMVIAKYLNKITAMLHNVFIIRHLVMYFSNVSAILLYGRKRESVRERPIYTITQRAWMTGLFFPNYKVDYIIWSYRSSFNNIRKFFIYDMRVYYIANVARDTQRFI